MDDILRVLSDSLRITVYYGAYDYHFIHHHAHRFVDGSRLSSGLKTTLIRAVSDFVRTFVYFRDEGNSIDN